MTGTWKNPDPYDEEAINAALRENMVDDPFGTSMYVVGQMLRAGLSDELGDHMNEHEGRILRSLARLYVGLDNGVACPACGGTADKDGHRNGYIVFDDGDAENGPRPNGPLMAACYICNLTKAVEEGWSE